MYISPSLTEQTEPRTPSRRFGPDQILRCPLWAFVAALILLMALIDAITSVAGHEGTATPWWGASELAAAPVKDFSKKQAGLTSCTLGIAIRSSRLTATYTLNVRPGSALITSLARSGTQADTGNRLSDSLGSVSLAEFRYGISGNHRIWNQLNFSSPVLQIGAKSATITLTSDPIEVNLSKQYVSVDRGTLSASSPVKVTVPGLQIADASGTDLESMSGKNAIIRAKAKDLTFTVSEPAAKQSWLMALRSVGGLALPLVGTSLSMANDALFCFLLFFGLRKASLSFPGNRNLATASQGVRNIAAALGAAAALELIIDLCSPASTNGASIQPYLTAGPLGIVVCGSVVAWPWAAWQVGRTRRLRSDRAVLRRTIISINASVLPAALGLYLIAIWCLNDFSWSLSDVALFFRAYPALILLSCLTAFFAFAIVSAAIWRYGLRPVPATVLAITSALLVFGTPLAAPMLWWNTSAGRVNIVGKIIFVMAALTLTAGLAIVICRTINALTFIRGHHNKISYKTILMVTAAAVIAASLVPSVVIASKLTSPHASGPAAWSLPGYLDTLTGLLDWLVLAIAVLSVMSLPPTRRFWPCGRYIAVPVLILVLLNNDTWLYMPVTVAVGVFLAVRLCLPHRLSEEEPAREHVGVALSGAIKAWRHSTLAADQGRIMAQAQGDPPADRPSGATRYPGDYASFFAAHNFLNSVKDSYSREANRLKKEAFSHYGQAPDRNAAEKGLYIGALLGIPATAVVLLIITNQVQPDGYPVLDFMDGKLWDILEWPLLGWFLGYYSPIIRGRNGFEKGLCLFAFYLLSSLPIAAATYNSFDWSQFTVYSSVLFVFLSIAGILVCDILPLKTAGMAAMDWVKVNNWRFVITWSTALVAALSTALVTFLSTTATDIGEQALTGGGTAPTNSAPASHSTGP